MAVFILLLLLLTNFFPSLLAHGFCCLPGPAALRLLGLQFLLIHGFSTVASACILTPAASSIPVALLPRGSSYFVALAVSLLLMPHASCLFKPSAASWISHDQFGSCILFLKAPIVSWLLHPFGPLLPCCFMASVNLWLHDLIM